MSRSAKVYIKGIYAGLLTEIDREHYSFCYDTDYYNNPQLPAVSLTMPKTQQEYTSSYLFPVFFNMTSEGDNLDAVPLKNCWRLLPGNNWDYISIRL